MSSFPRFLLPPALMVDGIVEVATVAMSELEMLGRGPIGRSRMSVTAARKAPRSQDRET